MGKAKKGLKKKVQVRKGGLLGSVRTHNQQLKDALTYGDPKPVKKKK